MENAWKNGKIRVQVVFSQLGGYLDLRSSMWTGREICFRAADGRLSLPYQMLIQASKH